MFRLRSSRNEYGGSRLRAVPAFFRKFGRQISRRTAFLRRYWYAQSVEETLRTVREVLDAFAQVR